jgi:hypothetical protein
MSIDMACRVTERNQTTTGLNEQQLNLNWFFFAFPKGLGKLVVAAHFPHQTELTSIQQPFQIWLFP